MTPAEVVERLFDPDAAAVPLAARMRPRHMAELVGLDALVGPDTPIGRAIAAGAPPSMVLWGPPGSGKTSLACAIAGELDAAFEHLSAVSAGVADVRGVVATARQRTATGRRTVLFLDEIHRFNRAQQDVLLPAVEDGTLVLIGATTENPAIALIAPLMSRVQLLRLPPLSDDDIRTLIRRALEEPRGLGGRFTLDADAEAHLVAVADGDARVALNALELAAHAATGGRIGRADVEAATRQLRHDRAGDAHYDQLSAFIKSLRGSDPDAAVYWLLRLLEAGEDPRLLARRMIIFASEDVGLADRWALPTAVAAAQAVEHVGLPEARYNLVHAAIALALAPKSNSVARALAAGTAAVAEAGNAEVPPHLRGSGYRGARDLGHGVGYRYPHDHPGGYVAQQYLPDVLVGRQLYEPSPYGAERELAERWARRRGQPAQRDDGRDDEDGSRT